MVTNLMGGTKLRPLANVVDTKQTLNNVTYFVRVGGKVVGYANDYTLASKLEGSTLVEEMRNGRQLRPQAA